LFYAQNDVRNIVVALPHIKTNNGAHIVSLTEALKVLHACNFCSVF